jgi:hypothetical protein
LADSQARVLEAFWQDTQLGAPPPVPHRGLLESLQAATAALSSESEDIAASQRLAERFAREPVEAPPLPARRQSQAGRPYIIAAAFMIFVTGGLAVYFLESGAGSKQAPDEIAQAASFTPAAGEPIDSLDEPGATASRALIPLQPVAWQDVLRGEGGGKGAQTSDRAAAESWASAVETLRHLAGAKNAPEQTTAGPTDESPQLLQQLEAWRKTNKTP